MKKKLIIISIILILLAVALHPVSGILSFLVGTLGSGLLVATLFIHLAINELEQMNEEAWKEAE